MPQLLRLRSIHSGEALSDFIDHAQQQQPEYSRNVLRMTRRPNERPDSDEYDDIKIEQNANGAASGQTTVNNNTANPSTIAGIERSGDPHIYEYPNASVTAVEETPSVAIHSCCHVGEGRAARVDQPTRIQIE